MASRGASLFAYFFAMKKVRQGLGRRPKISSKHKGGAKGLKFGKWYAHETQTRGKMLFFPLCVNI